MPAIPLFNADSPANRPGPVMGRESGLRLNPNQALAAIDNIANVIQRMPTAMPTINPDQEQGQFRGLQGLGDGIAALGGMFQGIREERQQAKDYADTHDAQLAMDLEKGRFEAWKIENPDPSSWEKEWNERGNEFPKRYMEGRELSPKAKEEITRRMGAFTQRQGMHVLVESTKATTRRAREAGFADVTRAIEAEDSDALIGVAEQMYERGWIGEDKKVDLQLAGIDEIETKMNQRLQLAAKEAINRQDWEPARAYIMEQAISDDEKRIALFDLRTKEQYNSILTDANELVFDKPEQALRKLRKDSDFRKLKPSDRYQLETTAKRIINNERAATIEAIRDEMAAGGVDRFSDLSKRDDFKSLAAVDQAALKSYAVNGALNDISDYMATKRKIESYDPSSDKDGVELSEFQRSIALRFDGSHAYDLANTLKARTDPDAEPLKPGTRAVSDFFSGLQDRLEAGNFGGSKITGNEIKVIKDKSGAEIYTVKDPEGDIEDKGIFGTTRRRAIELSEGDRIKFSIQSEDSKKDVYTDRKAKDAAALRFLKVEDDIQRRLEAGEFQTPEDMEKESYRLMRGELNRDLDSSMGFKKPLPGTAVPGGDNPVNDIDSFLNAIGR